MQIFVQTLGATLRLEVAPTTTVQAVMAMVEDSEFIPSAMQRLTCGGAQLCGASSLCAAGVGEADTLMLQLNVAGGMRAKWRKKRMRRLRRKRRKMRQRAR